MEFMGHLSKTFSVISSSSQLLKSLAEAGECNFYLRHPSLMLSFSLVQKVIDELKKTKTKRKKKKKNYTTLKPHRSLMHALYGSGLKLFYCYPY